MCAPPAFAKWSEILVYQSFRNNICYLATMMMTKSITIKELVMNKLMANNDNKDIVNDKDMGDGNIYNGGIDDEDLKDG